MERTNKRKVYIKYQLIKYKGGKCQKCGYDKIFFTRAFTFHHRDPTQKEFEFAKNYSSFEEVKKEADKCDLLCMRCHMEIHDEQYIEERKKAVEELTLKELGKPILNILCPECNQTFKKQNTNAIFCSRACRNNNLSNSKFDKKQWDIWQQENKSLQEIARIIKSTVKTVRKRAESQGWLLKYQKEQPLYEFSLDGKFKKEWSTMKEAAQFYGHRDTQPIRECLLGRKQSAGGSLWKRKDGNTEYIKPYNKYYRGKYSDELLFYIKYIYDFSQTLAVAKLARLTQIRSSYIHAIRQINYRPDIKEISFNKEEIKQKIEQEFKVNNLKENDDSTTN